MDPKQDPNQQLKPDLQAAYDRVMGTTLTGTPVPSTPTAPTEPAPATPITPIEPTMPPTPVPTEPTLPTTPTEPVTPIMPPTAPTEPPSMPPIPDATPNEPAMPTLPTTPIPAAEEPAPQPTASAPTEPAAPVPPTPQVPANQQTDPSMESLKAAMNMPQITHKETETVKIGMGGSPVGAETKPKSKGISPVILIVGAFAFLVVYAFFWMRFFNYSIPFLTQ